MDLFKQDLSRVVIPVNSVQSIDHSFPLPIGSWQAFKRLHCKYEFSVMLYILSWTILKKLNNLKFKVGYMIYHNFVLIFF